MTMNQDLYKDSAIGLSPQADHVQASVAGKVSFYSKSTILYFISEIDPDGNTQYKRFREQQKIAFYKHKIREKVANNFYS